MSDLFGLVKAEDVAGLEAALKGADLTRLHNEAGESLYRFALFHGHAKAAETIKALGVFGLHDAALTGDLARVEALLKAAPWAIDMLSPDGWTALHLAAFMGMDTAVEALLKHGANARIMSRAFEQNMPMHAAAAGRRIGMGAYAKLVAETGVDALQKQGYTALMIAASNGFTAAVEVLLAAGADKSIKLAGGKTAADIAADRGHTELAKLLAP